MVAMRERIPLDDKGAVDVSSWHRHLIEDGFPDPEQLLPKAIALLASVAEANPELNERGVQFANLVIGLQLDSGCAAAALLYRCHREKFCTAAQIAESTSSEVADLVAAVARMADSSLLEMSSSKMQSSEARDQVDNIRRMLVSMIDDGRVAILKLAERVVALRAAKAASEERKRRIAQEALLIFAPLANRLGIWHLKWELEDLALRYLEPDVYRALAKQLDGRRAERELQVKEIAESVQSSGSVPCTN